MCSFVGSFVRWFVFFESAVNALEIVLRPIKLILRSQVYNLAHNICIALSEIYNHFLHFLSNSALAGRPCQCVDVTLESGLTVCFTPQTFFFLAFSVFLGGKMELQALKLYLMSRYGVERIDALFWEVSGEFDRRQKNRTFSPSDIMYLNVFFLNW